MRPFKFWTCFKLALLGGALFGIASLMGITSHSSDTPVWDRQCSVRADAKTNNAVLRCGSYAETHQVDHAVAIVSVTPRTLRCRAFETRGPLHRLDVECGT